MAETHKDRIFPLHFLILLLLPLAAAASHASDLAALLSFKTQCSLTGGLAATWNLSAPCSSWHGVACSPSATGDRVTRLVLENLSLSCPIPAATLTALTHLRILSLKSNSLSGQIPDLSLLTDLKLLFLSHNSLSGPIPDSISSLRRLYRLDLSFNNLSGTIPPSIAALPHLLTLRLNSNSLSGTISSLSLPNVQDLNLSSNLLTDAIPASLASFPASAFAFNPSLCGAPLHTACANLVSDPSRPELAQSQSPVPPADAVVSSSPVAELRPSSNRGISRAAVIAIVVGDFAVLVAVTGLLFCYFWRKFATRKAPSRLQEGEKIVYSSNPYSGGGDIAAACGGGDEGGRMVFVEEGKRFELEDLLRASAEMLGKGGYGTAYKAVLDNGSVVAVKRLRDVQVAGKREFEHHMEVLGRLRHLNVVQLMAYYYARDEKLLVYEFMVNGSLFALLHGNRGPGRTPLDWTTRMRIAAGVARGLAFIHQTSQAPKLAHGNVKSTNVLIDKAGNARLADAGLALLAPAVKCSGYAAPEAPPANGRRAAFASQRADVYAFGLVLLELLTGRTADVGLPRWVASVVREEWTAEVFDLELMRYKGVEEEMVAMLQVAMACTVVSPDQRPGIGQVLRTIEEFSGGDGTFDSVSGSPAGSDDAAAGGCSQ